jgi:TP901 family phage tail tape measure protein
MAEDANARIRVDIDTAEALANIKNLQRQISAFHTSMAKGGAAAAATSLNMQQGLLNSINQTGKFSATIRTVKTTTDSFTDSLQKNKLSMGEYFRYAGASTKTFGRLFRTEFDTINKVARERVKDLQTQYIKMGRDANGAMRAIAVRPLALDMENLSTKTQIAAQRQALLNQLLKQGSTNLLNFGKNTQWAGRQLMVGFTVPLVMLGSVAAKTFMDMEKQAVRFKRVYGEMFTTTEQTNKALAEIKELANEFTKYGVAVSKTMELAADIAATGKMGAELTAQVAETTRLAVLGGVEQAEALQATISLTDAFGVSAEELAGKIDFLNAVENQTITSIEDLTIAIPKAGPVVQQLGGDVEDLTFFLTAMREGGINASEGANALKSGLAALINPTGKASEMLAGFGINIKGIVEANAGDVKGLVIDFASALDTLDPLNRARAIEQLFGKFQFSRLSTLFQNVIKDGNQASRVLKLTNATTEELAVLSEREMKRIEESPMFKFQKALEDIKVTLVPLGEAFLKAVTPLLEFGTSILKKFNELDEGAKGFVVGLTAVAGVIGPIFLMGFGLIANGVANVIKMFAFFKASMNKAGTASTQLGMQTDYMTQQQLEAAAVAASLDQIHQKLRQTFTSETAAVNALTAAYSKSIAAQGAMTGGAIGRTRPGMKLASGIMSVPGPKGAGDVVPAMLSPGEAVIPAKQSKKYRGIISSLIADNVPGFRFGRNPFASMLGRSKVAVRMKDSDFSSELAASGKNAKYKSAFDTQTGADYIRPSGSENTRQKELRSAMERDVFGLDPKTTPTSARPTYGYAKTPILSSFINKLFGIKGKNFNAVTRNVGEDSLAKYGNIDLVTKGSVAKRSSAFAGDALVNYHWAAEAQSFKRRAADLKVRLTRTGVKPAPMKGASPEQLGSFDRLGSPFKRYDNDAPAYVETYTPGGFAFNEIDKIIARDPLIAKRLKAELRAAGLGSVRVTGSNFAARLFKKMGVPGYTEGTGAIGPLTPAAAEEFEKLRGTEITSVLNKTRGATDEARAAHKGLTYSNAQKEIDDFIKVWKAQAEADGVDPETIKKTEERYRGTEVSHIAKDTRSVMIGGVPVDVKKWRAANLVADFGAVNQIISHIDMTKARDAKGKTISGKSFISSLDPKEIAAMAGISEKEAKKELKRLGRGEHPITAKSSRVLMAVADKYLPVSIASGSLSANARVKALKHILTQRIADGSFFAAAASGQLSLPKKLQADFDKEELRKQDQYLTGKDRRLGQARSRLIGPSSGVSKPARVKRTGGSTKDTRLNLLADGETVLTNDTTDTLRKGGSANIPGVGRIIGYGRNGRPIRVAGAYGGIPEGQTQEDAPRRQQQRDPVTGRFVSSKVQAPEPVAPTSRLAGIGNKVAGGASSIAGMAAMTYGMTGGPGADVAMMASMPLMMAQMAGKFAPLVIALTGIVAAAFALKNAFDQAQTSTLKLSEALGTGDSAVEDFAEFAGKASAGEIMDKRRANALLPFSVQTGKSTFGESFIQSEQGKGMASATRDSISKLGRSGTESQMVTQLVNAVSSGALDAGQARSIVSNIAKEIGDTSFGLNVNAKLVELLGVNGENLLEDPLTIRLNLAEDSEKQVGIVAGQMQKLLSPVQALGEAALATGVLAGSATVATGGPWGAVAGTIAGLAITGPQVVSAFANMGTASAAVVASSKMALQQQQQLLDSLDLDYEKRIAIAEAAGDLAKAEQLTNQYMLDRQALLKQGEETRAAIAGSFENTDMFGKMALQEAAKKSIENRYKDDADGMALAMGARQQVIDASGLNDTQEYMLTVGLASDLDPMVISELMRVFGSDKATLTKTFNLMDNLGNADTNRTLNVMKMFEDENGDPLVEQQASFVATISAKSEVPEEARKYLDMFESVSRVLDAKIVLTYLNEHPEAADKMLEMQQAIDAVDGQMDINFVSNLIGQENMAAFKEYEQYFNGLPDNFQKTFMTEFVTTMLLQGDEAMKGAFQTWLNEPGNKGKLFADFALDKGYITTEAQKDNTAAIIDEDPGTDGGGSGPTASSLDDVLKKLRDIRKNQVGVTKGFEASANAINKLFGGGAGINLFSGIENDMRRLGAEEDLISLIAGMDPEEFEKKKNTLFNFDRQTGEIIGFKAQLQNIGKALAAVALGQYVSDQQRSAKESRNQVLAFNQLRAAGYSVADAYEAVQDASVASAIATGNVTRDQMATMLQELKSAQAAMKEAARLTPEGLQEVFEEGFNKAMEAFDAQERKLTLEYELRIADDQKLIEDAQNQIDAIRYQIDDYEADLKGIEDQENAINDTYDEKLEALEKVRRANQKVLDQEKGKLSVAEAITRGDLAAAARAVQDVRQTSAAGYFSSQTDALNAGRQSALDAVRGENGLSRIQIEERIEQLANQIFEIEENTLEPATERVRLAGIELESRIKELEVLGNTKTEWETIKNNIDLARTNSKGYKDAMEEAKIVVQDVLNAWNGIESKEVVLTTIQRTIIEGTATGPNYTGPPGPDVVDDDTPPAATVSAHGQRLRTAMSSNQGLMNEVLKLSGADSGSPDARDAKLANYISKVTVSQVDALLAKYAKTPMGSIGNPYVAVAASSGTSSLTVPLGSYVKMPKNQYMHGQTVSGNNIILRWGPAENNINGKPVRITGNSIKAELGLDGKPTPLNRYAMGGFVSGPGTGTSDSVPAMLSNGEYVVKSSAVKQFGTRLFDNINAGSLPVLPSASSMSTPRFASVGSTASVSQSSVASRQSAPSSSNSVYNYSLSVNVASQSDPNTIAQTVMNQLRMVDSQRIRGNRF